jgi:hypothetical protein
MTPRNRVALPWGAMVWALFTLACVCARPFTFGFYVDDWVISAQAARAGAPSALLTESALARWKPRARLALVSLLVALGVALGVAQTQRCHDWASAWKRVCKILAEAPVTELRKTPPDSTILLVNTRDISGAPVFTAEWDLTAAIPWTYPEIQGRTFVVYNPWESTLAWQGYRLVYAGGHVLAETHDLYLWQPAQPSFARVVGPFHVGTDLVVKSN